ncbi:MAG: PEPxxWA-CTERM sorting domain-containing protein, partial [Sandarakinorhabdus sp.]|nr:PEPxxWA-CTERM sorting domain-containing protein [Sandarakinorhabdus sp.]
NAGLSNISFEGARVPEPATWGLLIVGFGMVGVAARRRKAAVAA